MLTSFANRKKSLSKLSSFSEGRHLLLISARSCKYLKGFACISRQVTAFITATMNISRSIVHHTENHCPDFELSITALPSVPSLVVKAHAAACFMDWFVSKTHAKRVWTCWKTNERTVIFSSHGDPSVKIGRVDVYKIAKAKKQAHIKPFYALLYTQCKSKQRWRVK